MSTILDKTPDGTLSLKTLGLKLEVSPHWLIKEGMNKNSQSFMDSMIEKKLFDLLEGFQLWWVETISDSKDLFKEEKKYKYKIHVKEIQDVADFARHVLPLHSDSECIEYPKEIRDALESACSFYKYNKMYDSIKKEINA